jgi:hypothetical protein
MASFGACQILKDLRRLKLPPLFQRIKPPEKGIALRRMSFSSAVGGRLQNRDHRPAFKFRVALIF